MEVKKIPKPAKGQQYFIYGMRSWGPDKSLCLNASLHQQHGGPQMAPSSLLPTQISLIFWYPAPDEKKGPETSAVMVEKQRMIQTGRNITNSSNPMPRPYYRPREHSHQPQLKLTNHTSRSYPILSTYIKTKHQVLLSTIISFHRKHSRSLLKQHESTLPVLIN